ncbi:hypothetical protein PSTG_01369 [Puccinia striiformis f. sp. tritici PST-78]|uniref:HMG box domain-containing protein n=1 Tax=Puccinia striiformis f. sp. tritici PST-78 TaxID=1165861 RepID=A0A0L0W227_9BASI|nr:hypothetical protein PSTG_01369 [Puccinia striiformis f. sp. tritici PST-78]
MRGPTTYNNFCRFDPKARGILSTKEEPLKVRCKEVGKLWATIDPETKRLNTRTQPTSRLFAATSPC